MQNQGVYLKLDCGTSLNLVLLNPSHYTTRADWIPEV